MCIIYMRDILSAIEIFQRKCEQIKTRYILLSLNFIIYKIYNMIL
jgi:hypothetical protein